MSFKCEEIWFYLKALMIFVLNNLVTVGILKICLIRFCGKVTTILHVSHTLINIFTINVVATFLFYC